MNDFATTSGNTLAPIRTRIALTYAQNLSFARNVEMSLCEILRRSSFEPQEPSMTPTSASFDFTDLRLRELLLSKMREANRPRSAEFWARVARAMDDIVELSNPVPTEGELERMSDAECESLLFEVHFMYERLQTAIAVSHYALEHLLNKGRG